MILLHGVGARPAMLAPIARAARGAGYRPVAIGYPSRRRSLEGIVGSLAERLAGETVGQDGAMHIVAHSMGGLVARALLAAWRPARLGRVVMLGTPNGGSEWVAFLARLRLQRLVLGEAAGLLACRRADAVEARLGPIDYPVGVIAGNRSLDPLLPRLLMREPHDGKVTVAATHLVGEADHIVLPVSHTLMLWNHEVHRQMLHFLTQGEFAR